MSTSTVERLDIYKSFFKELTFSKAMTGFKSEFLISRYANKLSMHNTFLHLWSYAGIAAFPVFAVIAWMIYYYRKAKILFVILLLFCLYSLSETVFFFRYPDLILFSLLFIALYKKLDHTQSLDT